jgi:hypothetical protein
MNQDQQEAPEEREAPYWTYRLIDPTDMAVRYVGMSQHPYQRYGEHLTLRGANQEKNAWILSLQKRHLLPSLEVIEPYQTLEEAQEKEIYWIQHYLNQGCRLTNKVGYSLNPHPHKWTKRKAINRMQRNGKLQEILRQVPQLGTILNKAIKQENIYGYDSVECYLMLCDEASQYVGWDASPPDLQTSECYDIVKEVLYDLLPPEVP